MGNTYTYRFDIHKKELVTDCNLYPTDISQSEHWPWLYAKNNKYPDDCAKEGKIGKWMLFLPKDTVNATWDKIKTAVTNGELWSSKVSTSSPDKITHAVMIYTKDYTDLDDVISVLNYLESSGIKSPNVISYYKTDQQTSAGIYSGGNRKPWIYSSDTIRGTITTETQTQSGTNPVCNKSNAATYQFDIHKKELIADCNLYPADICQRDNWSWLQAKNNKYSDECINQEKVGKWMIFVPKDNVNAIWDKIKSAVTNGVLWNSKVSTTNPEKTSHAVMIYTKDYTDLEDVIRVLNYLESSGIKSPTLIAYYKTEQQTRAGIYSGGNRKPWIYSSDTVRGTIVNKSQCNCKPVYNIDNIATYQFDIYKKELVASCNLYPTDIRQCNHWPWLYAKNNKYLDECINHEKVGKWMVFIPKDNINAIWDKIKTAITNGELWSSKVSTTNPKNMSHAVIIYTKDYTDLEDVIRVLNFLEYSEIKSPDTIAYYKTEQQTRAGIYSGGRQKPWIYSSETIRGITDTDSECSCDPVWSMGNVATYMFDIHKKEIISDCNLYPTNISHCNHWPWLYARNNKYEEEYINPDDIGKWMLFLSKESVNAAWDKIKTAVTNGDLWNSKVSTMNIETMTHAIMIYTKDYSDLNDVTCVLNYLESSGIKPPDVTIYYKTDQQTRAGIYSGSDRKPWIYSSVTIHEENDTD